MRPLLADRRPLPRRHRRGADALADKLCPILDRGRRGPTGAATIRRGGAAVGRRYDRRYLDGRAPGCVLTIHASARPPLPQPNRRRSCGRASRRGCERHAATPAADAACERAPISSATHVRRRAEHVLARSPVAGPRGLPVHAANRGRPAPARASAVSAACGPASIIIGLSRRGRGFTIRRDDLAAATRSQRESCPSCRGSRLPAGETTRRRGTPMLDQMHQPPAEIVARRIVDADGYAEMYAASIADPDAFWGEQGRRLDWIKPYTRVKNTSLRLPRRLDQVVRGRQAQRLGQLHRPPPRHPRRPDRDHLGERRPGRRRAHQLPRAARRGLEVRQRAARPRASRRATASSSTCR